MEAVQGTFSSEDGVQLFFREWLPTRTPRALVVLAHGGGEHSGRYQHVADHLLGHGYAVVACDSRGHGQSSGPRLSVRSFDEFVRDLQSFMEHMRTRHAQPPFVLGHSMGGTIATLCALRPNNRIRGLILSGPLLKIGSSFAPWRVTLARFLGRVVPWLPIDRVDPMLISRDANVVQSYKQDPLVHQGGIPAATASAAIEALSFIGENCHQMTCPLLLMHGTDDRVADIGGSTMLYERAEAVDKTFLQYEGFFHEIFNEQGNSRVLQDLTQWIGERADERT